MYTTPGKIPPGSGNATVQMVIRKKDATARAWRFQRESTAIVPLRAEIEVALSFECWEERDRLRIR